MGRSHAVSDYPRLDIGDLARRACGAVVRGATLPADEQTRRTMSRENGLAPGGHTLAEGVISRAPGSSSVGVWFIESRWEHWTPTLMVGPVCRLRQAVKTVLGRAQMGRAHGLLQLHCQPIAGRGATLIPWLRVPRCVLASRCETGWARAMAQLSRRDEWPCDEVRVELIHDSDRSSPVPYRHRK